MFRFNGVILCLLQIDKKWMQSAFGVKKIQGVSLYCMRENFILARCCCEMLIVSIGIGFVFRPNRVRKSTSKFFRVPRISIAYNEM
jgi:hypothetical protein